MKPTISEMRLERVNRVFYINVEGELFVQFKSDKMDILTDLENHVKAGELVHYYEELVSGHSVSGYVSRVTKSGVALHDWSVK